MVDFSRCAVTWIVAFTLASLLIVMRAIKLIESKFLVVVARIVRVFGPLPITHT